MYACAYLQPSQGTPWSESAAQCLVKQGSGTGCGLAACMFCALQRLARSCVGALCVANTADVPAHECCRCVRRRLHAARAHADERSEGLDNEQGVRHPDMVHGDSDRAAEAPLLL